MCLDMGGEGQWPSCPQVPTALYTTTAQLDTEAAEARRKWRRRQRSLGGRGWNSSAVNYAAVAAVAVTTAVAVAATRPQCHGGGGSHAI